MRGCRCALAEPLAAKRQRVAALLERLGLMACADTTIGDALSRGISGGQVPAALLSRIGACGVDRSSVCMDIARAKRVNEAGHARVCVKVRISGSRLVRLWLAGHSRGRKALLHTL